ncbi:MAG TPA: POTRA domain-containing protein [Terriglobia bacterium]|nr:POTRA domain-containing protein [Terriglobia bacterium]
MTLGASFFAVLLVWAPHFSPFLGQAGASQCAQDYRTNKNAGIHITDFTITGTQTISATDLARITTPFIGSCFDEDSEEMEERVRALFQDRGYFKVEVKGFRLKATDPLGIPKPVTLEAEVSEGLRYRLGEITFVGNHAFDAETLRQAFPLKTGEVFEREKIVRGLEALRKLYGSSGFLDYVSFPDTRFDSSATTSLIITFEEGPQYHMGKLDIVAAKEAAARLRAEWKLAEGDVFDNTYIDHYLDANRDLLPGNFSRENVQLFQNCPDALVEVRMLIDPAEDKTTSPPKNAPCKEQPKTSTQRENR